RWQAVCPALFPLSPQTDVTPAPEQDTDIRVVASKAHVCLQFPVPDLRPGTERRPWAEKAVRSECLEMEVADLEFHTQRRAGSQEPSKIEITFSDLHGVYRDGDKLSVPCIRISKWTDPSARAGGKKFIFPSILVTLLPQNRAPPWDLNHENMDELHLPSVESPCELKQQEPSPFSSKRTMYETEEMVIPADPDEMADFQRVTLASSQYTLEVTLPRAHIFLPSKDMYESLYNRVCNDLLMWESVSGEGSVCGSFLTDSMCPGESLIRPPYQQDAFRMCKSAFRLDSDSEEEDSHFYSVDDAGTHRKGTRGCHSFLSASVTILQGRITAWTEAKGEGSRRLEDNHGEIVLDIENGSIFSVSKYRGQGELSYLCMESDGVCLYHKATVPDCLPPTKLEVPDHQAPTHLDPTIYTSEEGVSAQLSGARKDRSPKMLSLAVRIDLDLERNVKVLPTSSLPRSPPTATSTPLLPPRNAPESRTQQDTGWPRESRILVSGATRF
ncbi:autophagy-related protein 2 homolog A-like, partial [Ascaphus truei]|uniref:autophagy-related protein 2 homolog A-like n=1 Tax=Ascaphus truei TaxID=8439 RepID=UPI003F5AA19D